MLGKRIINTATGAGAACTTDTVQILDGVPFQSIATYQFESDADDLTGNYDGNDSNVTYATGKFGNAGEFNGSSSNVTLPAGINKNNNFSWSFWVNFDSLTDYDTTIAFQNTYRNYLDILANGTLHFYDGVSLNSPTGTVTTGTWYHVVITKSSSTGRKMYLNNSVVASDSGTTNSISGGGQNMIGAYNSGSSTLYYLDGKIDQVRVYDKALSAGAVTSLYNETVATASNSYINLPSGVAYYKMSDATDETGSYDGTASNVNFNVAGKFGNAAVFNGSSSGINLPSSLNANVIDATGAFSISMWINANDISTIQYLFCANTTNNIDLGINSDSQGVGKIVWTVYNTSYSYLISTTTITTNTWYNIVVTYNNGSRELFINGVSQGTATKTLVESSIEPTLGYRNTGGSVRFNGKIDQVRIFDRAITSDEVETLYNEVQCIPTIVPTDNFEPVIYDGNGGTQSISSLDFQPDLVWMKNRDQAFNHRLADSVRGATKYLITNLTNAESTNSQTLTSFNLDGFTVGSDAGVNYNNSLQVAWNWKAGGAAVSNTDGTITSQVSANQDAGFSIVKWTNTVSEGSIGHGLNQKPELIIAKNLDVSANWIVYTDIIDGSMDYLRLNTTDSKGNSGRTLPTSSVFYFASDTNDYIAYAFHSVEGYSKVGFYEGTGAAGNSIVTGFRPAFVMIKRTDSTGSWEMIDNKRSPENVRDRVLFANLSNAEQQGDTLGYYPTNFLSNGFELLQGSNGYNANGGSYIFMAFAEENVQPEPELANSFNVVTYTGNGTDITVNTGLKPDMVWIKERTSTSAHRIVDSVRGDKKRIFTNLTNAESEAAAGEVLLDNGFQVGADNGSNQSGEDYVAWCWKASNDSTIDNEGSISSVVSANPASGFSIVKWAGNNTAGATVGHGLSSAPEMIIIKNYSQSIGQRWVIGHNNMASSSPWNYYLEFDTGARAVNNSRSFNGTAPTSSVFSVGNDTQVNSDDMIAYCFHSVDSYQKVGSYSGGSSGSSNVITTGFKPRFLLVKRTDIAGDAWQMFDSIRGGGDTFDNYLQANEAYAETSYSLREVNFANNGFYWTNAESGTNISGGTYIYLAIA